MHRKPLRTTKFEFKRTVVTEPVPRKERDPTTYARKYPWEEWFSNESFVLEHGVDFDCQMHGMAQQIRNEVVKLGKAVSISYEGNRLKVTVHDFPPKKRRGRPRAKPSKKRT